MRKFLLGISAIAILAGVSTASASDYIAARNHANCASPAMASCMQSPYDSRPVYVDHDRARARKTDRRPRAQAVYVKAPVQAVRYLDPLYASCETPWQFPGVSCPGVGN